MVLLLLLAAAVACAAPDPGPVGTLQRELAGLNLSAPEKDAARDIAEGKPHCYSVNGFSRHFPGIRDEKARKYCNSIEVNFEGTSDVVHGEEHSKLIRQASEYAELYNQYVVSRKVEP